MIHHDNSRGLVRAGKISRTADSEVYEIKPDAVSTKRYRIVRSNGTADKTSVDGWWKAFGK